MIHEYALEPELVATWGNRHDYRCFILKFGLGQPRIVSRYPERWARLVWQAFRPASDFESTRMTELLARLSEHMVRRRNYIWQAEGTWLMNAHREHERVPFHAILARENPGNHGSTLIAADLDETTLLWARPHGVTIARTAAAMAGTARAMLRIAEIIIFVDPNFRPSEARFRRPFEAFLRAVVDARPLNLPSRIELHVCLDEDRFGTRKFFEGQCQTVFRAIFLPGYASLSPGSVNELVGNGCTTDTF